MKKNTVAVVFFCFFLNVSFSQTVSVGVRYGINIATYAYKNGLNAFGIRPNNEFQNNRLWTFGLPLEIDFNNKFVLQIELNLTQKGVKSSSNSLVFTQNVGLVGIKTDDDFRITWLDLPILFKAKTGINRGFGAGVFFGPSFSYGFEGIYKGRVTNSTNNISTVNLREERFDFEGKSDVGLNIGGDLNFGGIHVDVRYQWGLNDISKFYRFNQTSAPGLTRNLAISVGYRVIVFAKKQKM